MRARLMAFAFALSVGGCASAPSAAGPMGATGASTTTSAVSANRITADDIARLNVPTAYEVVDRLHRRWFRDVAGEASYDAAVYLDNQRIDGGTNALRQIPAAEVASIEYLKATDAVLRFGQSAKGGAIIVVRK